MRVAVTGASGFIGGHVTERLERAGHEVLALGRAADGATLVPIDLGVPRSIPASDLTLEQHLEGTDAIIHLAARTQDSPATPLSAYLGPNVVLTEKLLEAALAAGVGRFVLASSRMVYPSWIYEPIPEDCPHPPDSFYGLSKRIAEDLVTMYTSKDAMTGVSLRIGQVFGAGDRGRGVLPTFIEGIRRGVPPSIAGSGAAVRDFVDVRDVAAAFELAVEVPTKVPAINIGSGGGYAIREMAEAAAIAGGMDVEAVISAPVESEDRSHYSLDCSLAQSELGWSTERTLVESIRDRLAADA